MQDFAYRIGVSGEIVEFGGFRLPDGRVKWVMTLEDRSKYHRAV